MMRALLILIFIYSTQLNAQEVPNVKMADDFINHAIKISKLPQEEFNEYGNVAVKKFTNQKGDDLLNVYRYAHALRYPETALVAGTQVYSRKSSNVKIPSTAKVIGQNEYTSMGSDWLTYELKDNAGNYYSITLNKNENDVVSRFVTKSK